MVIVTVLNYFYEISASKLKLRRIIICMRMNNIKNPSGISNEHISSKWLILLFLFRKTSQFFHFDFGKLLFNKIIVILWEFQSVSEILGIWGSFHMPRINCWLAVIRLLVVFQRLSPEERSSTTFVVSGNAKLILHYFLIKYVLFIFYSR